MKKYAHISLTSALLLLAALTGCPLRDSDDDSGESGSGSGSSGTSTGSSSTTGSSTD